MPSNKYIAVIRFEWTDDQYTFNDGAEMDKAAIEEDTILAAIDAYLEPSENDKFTVVQFDTITERNSDQEEEYLRNTLLGEP